MPEWDLSCRDWEERLRTGRSLVPDLPLLDHVAAERAVKVFNRLKLADVPGNPTLADAAGDWFRDLVRALFGSWDPIAAERWIREIFCLVPKKNSKTSYGAGLMLTALLLNKRPKAKFILTAPTQDVTALAFDQADGMIGLDDDLAMRVHIQRHLKKLTVRKTGATLEVMTFDPQALTGQKPTGFLVDELHVVAGMSKARSAIGQLRGGMIAQPEAFGIFITTQSENIPAGVFKDELAKARATRDGLYRGRTLPVLYEFPDAIAKDKEAWKDPAIWHMVIPNNGRSITVARLLQDFEVAVQGGEVELRRWASQHLDIEIGLALGSDSWAGAMLWPAAGVPGMDFDEILECCDVIVLGIDGGGLDDLLGLAVLGRDRDTRGWLLWNKAYADHRVLDRRKEIAEYLQDFAREGDLEFKELPRDLIDVADFARRVNEAALLGGVAVDPAGIGAVVDELVSVGIESDLIVGVSQGWKLSGAIKTAERKLVDGTLAHAAQPMMAWCVGNAKPEAAGNAITITKQTAGSAKIDPLIATFVAIALMSTNPKPTGHDGTLISIF